MKDFPLFRSLRAGIVGTLVLVVPLLFFSNISGMEPALIMLVMGLLPLAFCTAGLVCGAAVMGIGVLAGVVSMYLSMGLQGGLVAAVYLAAVAAGFVWVIVRRVPFWKGCAVMIGVHVAALAGCYLMVQQFTGGQMYTAAGDWLVNLINSDESGNQILYSLYQSGVITLPSQMQETALLPIGEGYILHPAARADLLLSVSGLVYNQLAAMVPSFLITQSILGGVLCLLLPLRFGIIAARRRAFRQQVGAEEDEIRLNFPDLAMPPLSLWHIPRGMGWKVGVALIVGSVLQYGGTPAMSMAGIILYAGAQALFALQGAAVLNFMQKAKGTGRHWRVIVPVLLYALSILHIVGIFDQITNARGLRKPPQPKEE